MAFPCISWIPAIETWGSRKDWKAHSKLRPKVYLFERFPVSSSRLWSAGGPAQCVWLIPGLQWCHFMDPGGATKLEMRGEQ